MNKSSILIISDKTVIDIELFYLRDIDLFIYCNEFS